MSLKDQLRKLTPEFLLNWNRRRKKSIREANLQQQKKDGQVLSKDDLLTELTAMGIQPGDHVLVHSSLSRIGYLEEGPKTLCEALLEAVGKEGTILMPTSPNGGYQLDYIREKGIYNVTESPSRMGAVTEYFRKLPGARRSAHPTEPVSALGSKAGYFTEGHLGEITPYTDKSPFARLAELQGKILYLGVTLANAGTSLHTLEDAVDFKFPVYYPEVFEYQVETSEGVVHDVKVKVHDPEWSAKRRCDELIPFFVEKGAMKKTKLGKAEVLLCDASAFFNTMVDAYHENGITMYTPHGS